jgi:malate dehydrogenase (oxaloacetate-decarboxylating)
VTFAGLINAFHLTKRKLKGSRIVFFGSGAANLAAARLVIRAGSDPRDLLLVDSRGILHPERADMDQLLLKNRWKYDLAIKTNGERISGGLREAMRNADVLVAASKPDPTLIQPEWIRSMNSDPVVFALANPVPEIWPDQALKGGAKIVATGRSDFPNQVNNSLMFPAVFRGILDVRSKGVTDEMVIVAAEALAKFAQDKGLREDYIIPTMEEWEVYPAVASSVGQRAVELGLARRKMSGSEIYDHALMMIKRARDSLKTLVDGGIVANPPIENGT